VAVFYGVAGEVVELAFSNAPDATVISGSGVTIKEINGATVLNWQVTTSRQIIQLNSDLYVYLIGKSTYLQKSSESKHFSQTVTRPTTTGLRTSLVPALILLGLSALLNR
jgi:hypothetical protein